MKHFLVVSLLLLITITCFAQMEKNKELYSTIGNLNENFFTRIDAIKNLDLNPNSSNQIKQSIKRIMEREIPQSDMIVINWDSNAAERIIDMYLIEVLNKLNDTSENQRVSEIIAQSDQFLSNEHGNDLLIIAQIIRSIHQNQVYAAIINQLKSTNDKEVRNAVFVLNKIDFSDAPTGGDTGKLLSEKEIKVEFNDLKGEMEQYANISGGKIILSPGIKDYVVKNNYDRGQVELDTTLKNILNNLSLFNFYYFVDEDKVVICTYQEAAERWIKWWLERGYKI